jgi:hypothetical protein
MQFPSLSGSLLSQGSFEGGLKTFLWLIVLFHDTLEQRAFDLGRCAQSYLCLIMSKTAHLFFYFMAYENVGHLAPHLGEKASLSYIEA